MTIVDVPSLFIGTKVQTFQPIAHVAGTTNSNVTSFTITGTSFTPTINGTLLVFAKGTLYTSSGAVNTNFKCTIGGVNTAQSNFFFNSGGVHTLLQDTFTMTFTGPTNGINMDTNDSFSATVLVVPS